MHCTYTVYIYILYTLWPCSPLVCMQPAEDGGGETGDDGYASVGGTTPAALRAWLRHMREFTYQVTDWL